MISAGLPASSLSQFARRYRYFQEEKTRHVWDYQADNSYDYGNVGQYCAVQIDDEWLEWFLLSVLCTKPGIPDG